MNVKKVKRRKFKDGIKSIILTVAIFVFMFFVILNYGVKMNTDIEQIEVHGIYEEPKAYLGGIDISGLLKVDGEVNTDLIGSYELKYNFSLFGFSKIESKIVEVVDQEKPIITLEGNETCYVQKDINNYIEQGFEAIDNYDGDITDKVEIKKEKISDDQNKIIYSVRDSSGNYTSRERIVNLYTGTIYLTFDDGPSVENTAEILNILEKNNIKATFFIVNYSEKEEDLVKQEYISGHTIGIHGYSHDYSYIYSSVDNLICNFTKLRDKVYMTTKGYDAKFIRFPGGSSNTISKKYCTGIMTRVISTLPNLNFVYYDWNVDVNDAGGAKTSNEIYQNFIKGILPNRENVVLLHDSNGHKATTEALEDIIRYGLDNGYIFKNITDETIPIMHKANN